MHTLSLSESKRDTDRQGRGYTYECVDDSEILKTPTTEMCPVLEILASIEIEISIIVSYFSKRKLSETVCFIFVSNRTSIGRIIVFDMERTVQWLVLLV